MKKNYNKNNKSIINMLNRVNLLIRAIIKEINLKLLNDFLKFDFIILIFIEIQF